MFRHPGTSSAMMRLENSSPRGTEVSWASNSWGRSKDSMEVVLEEADREGVMIYDHKQNMGKKTPYPPAWIQVKQAPSSPAPRRLDRRNELSSTACVLQAVNLPPFSPSKDQTPLIPRGTSVSWGAQWLFFLTNYRPSSGRGGGGPWVLYLIVLCISLSASLAARRGRTNIGLGGSRARSTTAAKFA